jgi:CRISPR-associated protein Cas1
MNAVRNYAYALLESQVRITASGHGLDPTVGYLRASHPRRLALVYDLMERLRPQVDRQVLEFVGANTLSPADFLLIATGVCRPHPQLARRIAGLSIPSELIRAVVRLATGQLGDSGGRPAKPQTAGLSGSGVVQQGRPSRHTLRRVGPARHDGQ